MAAASAGFAAGARRAVLASLRLALPLLVLMAAINALVSHRGETVLLRGWQLPVLGNTDVTLESLAAGGTIGLRVLVVFFPSRSTRPASTPTASCVRSGRWPGARR